MGQVCGSLNLTPEEKEKAKKSGQLDSLLKKRNNEVKEEVKLLLLGKLAPCFDSPLTAR